MRVLYATDGSEAAVAAGRLLEALADRSAVQVTVLSVVPAQRRGMARTEALRSRAEQIADDAAASLREAGLSAEVDVTEGRAAREITQRSPDYDLIVIGSGNHGWMAGRLLGSVGSYVLQQSARSVLVVHEAPPEGLARVLVTTDGSADARCGLEAAVELLEPERCEVVVLSVAELLAPILHPPYVAHATSAPEGTEEEATEPARRLADEAVQQLEAAGFRAQPRVVLGHPLRRVLSEAQELAAALVVVGSRGLNPLDRVVLGSVSDQVARQAPATLMGRPRPGAVAAGERPAEG